MKAIITNTGNESIPVVLWRGNEPAMGTDLLPPGQSLTVESDDVGRIDVNEVPTFRDDLASARQKAGEVLRKVIQRLLNRPKPELTLSEGATSGVTSITVLNNGTAGINALCGSNLDAVEVAPGETAELKAPGATPGSGNWIELRQLEMA